MIIIYILFIYVYRILFILSKNKPVKKHVCVSQRRNGRVMTSRRRQQDNSKLEESELHNYNKLL